LEESKSIKKKEKEEVSVYFSGARNGLN